MTTAAWNVTIVGAASLVGREIVAALDERDFPLGRLRAFDELDACADDLEFRGTPLPVESIEDGIGSPDLVFLAGSPVDAAAWADMAVSSGAAVVDCTGHFAGATDVPLIVPECNPGELAGFGPARIVASPDPLAVVLSMVIAPLQLQFGVSRIVVTSVESVSESGADGIDELSRQTVELLNGRSVECTVFPSRICFNVLPELGSGAEEAEARESRVAAEVKRIVDSEGLEVSCTRTQVPAFFGIGASIYLEFGAPVDPAAVEAVLRESPGVQVVEPSEGSLAEGVGQDAARVSRIRADAQPDRISLWVSFDNLRKGRAINAVQVAELLIRDHL